MWYPNLFKVHKRASTCKTSGSAPMGKIGKIYRHHRGLQGVVTRSSGGRPGVLDEDWSVERCYKKLFGRMDHSFLLVSRKSSFFCWVSDSSCESTKRRWSFGILLFLLFQPIFIYMFFPCLRSTIFARIVWSYWAAAVMMTAASEMPGKVPTSGSAGKNFPVPSGPAGRDPRDDLKKLQFQQE